MKIGKRPPGRRRARRRLPIARMSACDMRAGRAREANAGRKSMRDDGLAVRKLLRKWPVDAGGWVRVLVAPPRAYVAQIRRLPRRWLRALLRRWNLCWPTRRCSPLRKLRAGRVIRFGGGACPHAPREVLRGGTAGRPPLRRCSGDVVTAGLNSSRVWFGPVPGSP
ncbi:hypothetical protein F511_46085 [Dorcoceras hygrometricum]|uniref:Uncharacterized protein n=1 Tax=Dorcoceras hygrometricum TaxID=472368 RepID=A0A2Z6ZUV8_9LAMI|nr:hypothetical protein F511_46085 [Dorcoceras hygrometricum]